MNMSKNKPTHIKRTLCNQGVNFGVSSRLDYDPCYISDTIAESTGPLEYRLNSNQMYNCNGCLTTLGPRTSQGAMSNGVSLIKTESDSIATSQRLIDLDSILSNRNVKQSKCKSGKVNNIDVTKFALTNLPICNNYLDPVSTHLTNPPQNYRGLSINRFYDLRKDPQANIYYDIGINSKLEAKDNFIPKVPKMMADKSLPIEMKGPGKRCNVVCY